MNSYELKRKLVQVFCNSYNGSSNIGIMLVSDKNNNIVRDLSIEVNTPIEKLPLSDARLSNTINYAYSDIGLNQFSNTSLYIGSGLGALAGLSYGYWDYVDSKLKSISKGEKLPDKKKILIKDILIGLGIGSTAGTLLTEKIFDILEDKKINKKNKTQYDYILDQIMRSNDKSKLKTFLNANSNDITRDQYNTLYTIINSINSNKVKPIIPKMLIRNDILNTHGSNNRSMILSGYRHIR